MKVLYATIAVLAVVFLGLLWYGHDQGHFSGPVVRVSAEKFFEDYRENPARADLAYRGRRVELDGTVDNIRPGGILTLRSGNDFWGVPCAFLRSGPLAKVEPGQRVRVVGVCRGNHAVLTGCSLVE